MEITLSELADFANSTADGKLNVIGIIKNIRTAAVPVMYPHMALVLMMEFTPGEKGTPHTLQVLAVDADGKPILPGIQSQFLVPNAPGPVTRMNLVLGIVGANFPRFGSYSFDILIDGQSKARIPISVDSMPGPGQVQPPHQG